MTNPPIYLLLETPVDWRPKCFAWGQGHTGSPCCKVCPFREECLDPGIPQEEESIAYA